MRFVQVPCVVGCKIVLPMLLAFVSLGVRGEIPNETEAFRSATESWVRFVSTGKEEDVEIVWTRALKTLALSRDPVADTYLAKLSLFRLDGSLSTEYGCAASKRSMRLAGLLKERAKRFSSRNFCHELAKSNNLDSQEICVSQGDYAHVLRKFRSLPMKDTEGACSY